MRTSKPPASINRVTAGPIMRCEIASLYHELTETVIQMKKAGLREWKYFGDDAVKGAARVTESMLTSRQLTEVLGCPGHDVIV